MKFLSLFESLTQTRVKDCFILEGVVVFVVQPGQLGRALGKKGFNVQKLNRILKKKIKIVEFSENKAQFVRSYLHHLDIPLTNIKEEDDSVIISGLDRQTKAQIIGRDKKNLNTLKDILSRYFGDVEVSVV